MASQHDCVRIVFVRHGLTDWNRESRYQGQTDIELSEDGVRQAEAVGRRLAEEKIHRIYSSDLKRARATAEKIAAHHEISVIVDERLRELSFGEWEGLTFEQITAKWPELQKKWIADPVNFTSPGGESARDLEKRVFLALQDIRKDLIELKNNASQDESDIPVGVIVSHGGVIRWLMAFLTAGTGTDLGSKGIQQASVTVCELSDAGMHVITWNDTSHLTASNVIPTKPV